MADSVMAILLSGTAQNLAAPLPIITDRSLLFTRPLLLDAARVKGELLFGFCHPGAYMPDRARVCQPESLPRNFRFSVFARRIIYTRTPLNSRSSRIFSAGCFHGPWNGPVLSLRRIPKLETDPLSTCASDTFPAPASLAAEICSGLRLGYPAGKGSEAIRRTMLPNSADLGVVCPTMRLVIQQGVFGFVTWRRV